MEVQSEPPADTFDVIIIGGALSGAASAILLLRRNPEIRILIVEKTAVFPRKVGEATVEVSAFFLGRVLGLTAYLNEAHLVKQGLRFWFANDGVKTLEEASEAGPRYLARLPSYQVDRSALDTEVLRRAVDAGAELVRPAKVEAVRLVSGSLQEVTLRQGAVVRNVTARWVVDASGPVALLARSEGWWQGNTAHPTAAAWARWKGVKDWDGRELAEKFPAWSSAVSGTRNTATNHVVGDGWWSWWIPLKGGDVSVGVVWDQRLVSWPQDRGKLGARIKEFLMRHPVAREMLADAEPSGDDVHWRKNLAYRSTVFAGDGFVLVGDAAAFLDPFYSPGMDWISYTVSRAVDLISEQRKDRPLEERIVRHNRDFTASAERWFDSLYRDKYEYIGEYDLLSLAFRLDLGLYYWGVAEPVFHDPTDGGAFLEPPFSPPSGRFFGWFMSTYNRRFASIARRRRRLGLLGRSNRGRRLLIPGFTLERKNMLRIFPLLAGWVSLEIREGWRSWGR